MASEVAANDIDRSKSLNASAAILLSTDPSSIYYGPGR